MMKVKETATLLDEFQTKEENLYVEDWIFSFFW